MQVACHCSDYSSMWMKIVQKEEMYNMTTKEKKHEHMVWPYFFTGMSCIWPKQVDTTSSDIRKLAFDLLLLEFQLQLTLCSYYCHKIWRQNDTLTLQTWASATLQRSSPSQTCAQSLGSECSEWLPFFQTAPHHHHRMTTPTGKLTINQEIGNEKDEFTQFNKTCWTSFH